MALTTERVKRRRKKKIPGTCNSEYIICLHPRRRPSYRTSVRRQTLFPNTIWAAVPFEE